jgi:hypothetical protein
MNGLWNSTLPRALRGARRIPTIPREEAAEGATSYRTIPDRSSYSPARRRGRGSRPLLPHLHGNHFGSGLRSPDIRPSRLLRHSDASAPPSKSSARILAQAIATSKSAFTRCRHSGGNLASGGPPPCGPTGRKRAGRQRTQPVVRNSRHPRAVAAKEWACEAGWWRSARGLQWQTLLRCPWQRRGAACGVPMPRGIRSRASCKPRLRCSGCDQRNPAQ